MKAKLTILTALICGLIAQAAYAAQQEAAWSPDESARLKRGEIIVRQAGEGSGERCRVTAAILIPAPPRSIWGVMLDYAGAPEFLPGVESCRVLQSHPGHDIVEQTVDLFALLPKITYVFRSDYVKYRRIDFQRISGDLADMRCTCALLPQNGGQQTLLTYSIHLDPGFLVPQSFVDMALREDLPTMLKAIKNRVLSRQARLDM